MANFRITGIEVIGGDEALQKAVEKAVKESNKFELYDVVVSSDHASYVEYGTGPANPTVPGAHDFMDSAKARIERWVSLKPSFATMTPRQRKNMAYAVYKKVMEHGITPAPFIRPAIHDMLTTENLTKRFEEGMTMEQFAESLAARMRKNLLDNDSYYTGDLMDSIQVVRADEHMEEAEESIADEQKAEEWNKESNEVKKGRKRT